jgi:hypothetical protein
MRIFGAVLGAIAGAVIGYFAAFVVVYPILVAIDGPDMDGGLAMGVAVGIGPLMAIVFAFIFLFLILRLTRPKTGPDAAAPEPVEGEPDPGGELAEFEPAFRPGPAMARKGPDSQAMIAIGLVIALVIGGVVWLNYDGTPGRLSGNRPLVVLEMKIPAAEFAGNAPPVSGEMISVNDAVPMVLKVRDDGADPVILTGRVQLLNKTDKRELNVWVRQNRRLVFKLPLAARPETGGDFSGWLPVDRVERSGYPLEGPPEADAYLRIRVEDPRS